MNKTKLYLAAAGIAVFGLALPAAAEEPVFETELVIDLSNPNAGDEIDLPEMFDMDDAAYAEEDYDGAEYDDAEYDYEYDDAEYDGEDMEFGEDDAALLDDPESEDESFWYVYRYSEEGADQIVINDVMISLPENWTDKYDMILEPDRVTFFHRLSRAGHLLEGSEGGRLFSLCVVKNGEEIPENLPDYTELGEGSDGVQYYLEFPTDAQAYPGKEEIAQEYTELYANIDDVKENSFIISYDFESDEVEEAFTE